MSMDTPAALGLSADDLWQVLALRHALVAIGSDGAQRFTEAVLVCQTVEQAVLFVPQPAAPAGTAMLLVDADGDDDLAPGNAGVHGGFVAVPIHDLVEVTQAEVPGGELMSFGPDGALPSLGQVALSVPLASLPDDLADTVRDLAFQDGVDDDDFQGPLFPDGVSAPSHTGLLFGDPTAPPPPSAPPLGRGRGMPPLADAPPGRGRACGQPSPPPTAAAPGLGVASLPAGGRGRGGTRRATSPRPSLASVTAQVSAGFAAMQEWQRRMDMRMAAVENRQARAHEGPPPAPLAPAAAPPGLGPQPAPRGGADLGPSTAAGGGSGGTVRTFAAAIGSLLPRSLSPPRGNEPPPPGPAPMDIPAPVPQALAGGMTPMQHPLPGTRTPLPIGIDPAAAAGGALGIGAGSRQQQHQQAREQLPAAAPAAPGAPPDPALRLVMEGLAAQSRVLTALARGVTAEPGELGATDPLQSAPLAMTSGRAAETLSRWRSALQTSPESILQRVRSNRNVAMQGAAVVPGAAPTYRNFLSNEVPFGGARTGAYLMFALADVLDLLEAGRAKEAEALGAMALTAGEQAALQGWTWNVAWSLAFVPEPPWQRIRVTPTPEHARVGSRLADPALLTAVVARFQQTTALAEAQRKASGFQPPGAQQQNPEAGTDTPPAGGGGDKAPRKPRRGRGAGRGAAGAAGAE